MSMTASTSARYDLVGQKIFDAAVRLFAEQGFSATSLRQVADSVGVSRPTLYYYFKTKDEFLHRLVGEVTRAGADTIAEIAAKESDPLQRIRLSVSGLLGRRVQDPLKFRALDRCEVDLGEDLAEAHRNAKRSVLRLLTQMISDGQSAGVVRAVDPRVAALGMIGMCNWVAWWYVPGEGDPGPIIEQLTEMAFLSVSTNSGAATEPVDPGQVIAGIRVELARLEKML
jgi:AcrR family transcriptional regulator